MEALITQSGAGSIALGLGIMAVGAVLLGRDVPFWNTTWFLWAWIGWLVVLDGLIHRIGRCGFLATRPRELGAMGLWSVPFWTLFEGYNLVIENWYYVFLPRSEWVQAGFAFLAFATVLPACFFHAELLRVSGWDPRGPRVWVRGPVEWLVGGFGALCVVAPLLWPRTCFWMVWGATLGVPAVLNYRLGHPSLLRDLEQGRWGRTLRLLAGGLWAGGMWEGMNYWARTKWVYTVPGFEELKLFEMPVLGFVGFPFLALEAFAAYSLFCAWFRAGRSFERADAGQRRVPLPMQLGQVGVLVAFSVAADAYPLDPAVMSARPVLEEIEDVDPAALRARGIATPEHLVASNAGSARARLHAHLALHKGMGPVHATTVLAAVGGVSELVGADPEALHARLERAARARGAPAPTRAQVAVWIRAAREDGHHRR